MNLFRSVIVFLLAFAGLAQPALARDDVLHLSFQDVLDSPEAKSKLDNRVRFYLAGQATPKVIKPLGSDVSNPKTNSFNKTPLQGCQWAALSALLALQKRVLQKGGNAVVNITSYYKKVEYSSATHFECHDGALLVGVALKGTYAIVAD
jgi:hypothetical protein